jgi:hypothetical protein
MQEFKTSYFSREKVIDRSISTTFLQLFRKRRDFLKRASDMKSVFFSYINFIRNPFCWSEHLVRRFWYTCKVVSKIAQSRKKVVSKDIYRLVFQFLQKLPFPFRVVPLIEKDELSKVKRLSTGLRTRLMFAEGYWKGQELLSCHHSRTNFVIHLSYYPVTLWAPSQGVNRHKCGISSCLSLMPKLRIFRALPLPLEGSCEHGNNPSVSSVFVITLLYCRIVA